MTTITIQTNDDYGQVLYRKLKADKKLKKVVMKGKESSKANALTEVELTLPGKEMEEEALVASLALASRGRSLSVKEARSRTFSKIALWRKRK